MIIECEKCESKFELDESVLKPNGAKVRCSLCKHVFAAYPPQMSPSAVHAGDDFQETVALDSPRVVEETRVRADRSTSEEIGRRPGEGPEVDFDDFSEDAEESEQVADAFSMEEMAGLSEEYASIEPQRKDEPVDTEKKRARPRVLWWVGLVALLLAGGAVLIYFKAPGFLPEALTGGRPSKKEAADIGVRRLAFSGVNGAFVESKILGQLFVIKGMVANNYPASRSFILVKGSILDEKGEVVARKTAYAGNTFDEDRLKEMTLGEIDKVLKNRSGQDGSNSNVQPGTSLPFMIVFENLPENLSEFTVEAVSSSPGQ